MEKMVKEWNCAAENCFKMYSICTSPYASLIRGLSVTISLKNWFHWSLLFWWKLLCSVFSDWVVVRNQQGAGDFMGNGINANTILYLLEGRWGCCAPLKISMVKNDDSCLLFLSIEMLTLLITLFLLFIPAPLERAWINNFKSLSFISHIIELIRDVYLDIKFMLM